MDMTARWPLANRRVPNAPAPMVNQGCRGIVTARRSQGVSMLRQPEHVSGGTSVVTRSRST